MFSSRNHGFDAVVTCSCSKGGYNKAPKSWKSKDYEYVKYAFSKETW